MNDQSDALHLSEDTALDGDNAVYLEMLLERYLSDRESVSEKWRAYFDKQSANGEHPTTSHTQVQAQYRTAEMYIKKSGTSGANADVVISRERQQSQIMQMINAYRSLGHLAADINPLAEQPVMPDVAELKLSNYQLDGVDLDTEFDTGDFVMNDKPSLNNIYRTLRNIYTGHIGIEYMHIANTEERQWFQQRFEADYKEGALNDADKLYLLDQLVAAETLERYLDKKYVGQKRFSLEGGESAVPLINKMIHHAGDHDVQEFALGMAHRGRINVLINVMGKPAQSLFDEFEGKSTESEELLAGDVKYHKGYSSDIKTENGQMHIVLAFNPSHLEIVSPVVDGSVRAREDRRQDTGTQVANIVIHGDAAFAGQGVVMETFNMAQTRGYTVNGTVHLVINNQIGFTTSTLADSRSTYYATDVAKMVNAPIIHVNGDDPEAVARVADMAMDYRLKFKKDIVIDLMCYRRKGHNEADEPAMTQPVMYSLIKNKKTAREKYAEQLAEQGLVSLKKVDNLIADYKARLDDGQPMVDITSDPDMPERYQIDWSKFLGKHWREPYQTRTSMDVISAIAKVSNDVPEGFAVHRTIQKLLNNRKQMLTGEKPIDWGCAETLAYATLLKEGYDVRISGQDSGRGTFSHRQAVIHNQDSREQYVPLKHIDPEQGRFDVYDSVLSEEAVLAFEYGYAMSSPGTLVIWEAQFGDFANGAQVVIDQFISSGEHKWGRLNHLVMMLPHGYEGMGSEHSSARPERFLQLCADDNMQVCYPSTSSQIFHLLRRQMIRTYRHPLVILTPKSLLRSPAAASDVKHFTEQDFQDVIDDNTIEDGKAVKQVVLCSGKIYHEIQAQNERKDIALIRVEQLYPFPDEELIGVLSRYPNAKKMTWCQEEPLNQGSWDFIQPRLRKLKVDLSLETPISRVSSAVPAVGSFQKHQEQQQAIIDAVLKL